MQTLEPHSSCNVVSIRQATASAQQPCVLALLLARRVLNLSELVRCIGADYTLCRRVLSAASREQGWPRPRVEEAIVLLGQQGLCALFAAPEVLEGKTT